MTYTAPSLPLPVPSLAPSIPRPSVWPCGAQGRRRGRRRAGGAQGPHHHPPRRRYVLSSEGGGWLRDAYGMHTGGVYHASPVAWGAYSLIGLIGRLNWAWGGWMLMPVYAPGGRDGGCRRRGDVDAADAAGRRARHVPEAAGLHRGQRRAGCAAVGRPPQARGLQGGLRRRGGDEEDGAIKHGKHGKERTGRDIW